MLAARAACPVECPAVLAASQVRLAVHQALVATTAQPLRRSTKRIVPDVACELCFSSLRLVLIAWHGVHNQIECMLTLSTMML